METNTNLPNSGEITAFVGNDDYPLRLRIGELRALQSELNSGPGAVLTRLQLGDWYVDDVIEPIRLGLIGGGMSQKNAKMLVTHYVADGYLLQYQAVALRLLMSVMVGNAEDQAPVGETTDQAMTTPDA